MNPELAETVSEPDNSSPREPLAGRVAVVTGATSGIGRATALLLAARGAAVLAAARRQELGVALVAELEAAGRRARFVRTDVTNRADVDAMIQAAVEAFGRLDVVVNNAAAVAFHSAEDTSDDEWDRVLTTNLSSVFWASRAAIPHLRSSGGGSIINVASVHAVASVPNYAAYAASKGAVVALTRQMALDYAADRIRVNAVVVGSVDTEMSHAHGRSVGSDIESHFDPGDRRPGRMASPDEVARVIAFLATEEASFVTGSPVIVDGGMLARLF